MNKNEIVTVKVYHIAGAEPWEFQICRKNVPEFVASWEAQGYATDRSKKSFKPDPYHRAPMSWRRRLWLQIQLFIEKILAYVPATFKY